MKQLGFYLDQSRCSGCYTCTVACKEWNDVPAGPANWRWVKTIEEGKYPYPRVVNVTLSCLHCAKPLCIDACPLRALDAGPVNELKAKYGDIKEVEGFTYSTKVKPSIVFKPQTNKLNPLSSSVGR